MQDVIHVDGQGSEQGVVGPVGAHLGDDDGPQTDRQHHGQQGHRPAVTLTLKFQFRLHMDMHMNIRRNDCKVRITPLYLTTGISCCITSDQEAESQLCGAVWTEPPAAQHGEN